MVMSQQNNDSDRSFETGYGETWISEGESASAILKLARDSKHPSIAIKGKSLDLDEASVAELLEKE